MKKLIIASLLLVNDFSYLLTSILKVVSPLTSTDVKLKLLCDRLDDINHRLVQNLKSSQSSLYTDQKVEADKQRDLRFRCVRDQLHGLMFSYDSERSTSATQLYTIIEKVGTRLYDRGYKVESSLLEALFDAFDAPGAQAQLSTLNLLSDYQALKTSENEFLTLDSQFQEEKTSREINGEAASDIVDEMVPELNKLVAYMQLYSELEAETYAGAFNQMVTIINEVNATARARKTRNENMEPEPPNTPAQPM